MDDKPDAEYLARTIGQPLSLAVAEVCIVQPADPIEWLSGWLYKYVDSAEWLKAYKREQWEKSALDGQSKRQLSIQAQKESEQNGLRISSCNYLSTLKDDPCNLWKNAIKAVTTFTGASAVYIAAVVEPVWEPEPPKEEGEDEDEEAESEPAESEGEEGEERDEDEETVYDSEEEERISEKERRAEEEAEAAAAAAAAEASEEAAAAAAEAAAESETEGETDAETEAGSDEASTEAGSEKSDKSASTEGETTAEGGDAEKPPEKPPKPPRPVKYKKLICKYMAASPNNLFMCNKEMKRKMGPLTFGVLEKGLLELHVPNVLYRKGIYFFGGLPRLGAYYVAPITLPGTMTYPPRVNTQLAIYDNCDECIKYSPSIERVMLNLSPGRRLKIGQQFPHPLQNCRNISGTDDILKKCKFTQKFDLVHVICRIQVVGLLCADTLKFENSGSGDPFKPTETAFMQNVAKALAHAMNQDLLEGIKDIDTITPPLIEKIKTKFKEIKVAHKQAVKEAAKELRLAQKAKAKEEREKEKQKTKDAKAEAKKKREEGREARKKEREARRKERQDAGEEVEEDEEEEEEAEEEEVEPEEEEVEEEVEDKEEGESGSEATGSEAGTEGDTETETDGETEAGTEGDEEENEPEEPESDPEDWGEEPKEEREEGEHEEGGDAETTETEETEADETEGEETEEETEEVETEEDTEASETDGEGTEAFETSGEETEGTTSEGEEEAKVVDPEVEKKKAEKRAKAEAKKLKVKERKKLAKDGAKKIKDKQKEIAKLEKALQKAEDALKETNVLMTKLEISLAKGDVIVKHHQLLVSTVMDHMLELKDQELKRIKCIPFPRRRMFRVLKALLYILGHKKYVVDDWIGARVLVNTDFVNGLTGKKLMKEAPFAYLGLKWLLRLKKLSTACAHFSDIKTKFEAQSKAMAAADLARLMCQVHLNVVKGELKKMTDDEKVRLDKVAAEEEVEAEEEAKLKAIEDAEEAARVAAEEAAAEAAETSEAETSEGGETEGDETETEAEEEE